MGTLARPATEAPGPGEPAAGGRLEGGHPAPGEGAGLPDALAFGQGGDAGQRGEPTPGGTALVAAGR